MIIQVGSFKLTGKRVFRMAPLQHHFELVGWNEVTIVIRFWIIAGLFVALGLGAVLCRVGCGSNVSSAPIGGRLDGLTSAGADWSGLRVLVAGVGVSGFAAADALHERGARVMAVDGGDPVQRRRWASGRTSSTSWAWTSASAPNTSPACPTDACPTSSSRHRGGARPAAARAAAQRGIPVWGEVELAWRMRAEERPAPWLTVTGTNGKTTTVNMLASILRAAGLRATSAGNVGTPILEAVLHPEPYDVIAVELSSFQLHWSHSLEPLASACLNVAPDHVDWHGSFEEYASAKGKVYENTRVACVYNVQDPATEQLVMDADVQEGCRAIGFTLGTPGCRWSGSSTT